MRIFGGHDYYDCGMAYGRDPDIMLVRDRKPTYVSVKEAGFSLLPKCKLDLGLRNWRFPAGWELKNVAVAFCAKVYRGAILTPSAPSSQKPELIWSADRLYAFNNREKKRCWIGVERSWRKKTPTPEEYMAVEDAPPSVREYMIAHRIAILVEEQPERRWEESQLRINPTGLKQLGFAKALDPYMAFQELSMWIGGVLGGVSPEIVRITDDKVLIENHGYDKHSFRSSSRVA